MQHWVDVIRLRKLTRFFIAMDCVVGKFGIDQRATHFDKESNGDCASMKMMLIICVGSLPHFLRGGDEDIEKVEQQLTLGRVGSTGRRSRIESRHGASARLAE